MNYLEKLIADKGFTLDALGRFKTQNYGYQVSTLTMAKFPTSDMDSAKLEKVVYNALKTARERGRGESVGLWLDNGYVYIDLSLTIQDIFEALTLAVALNEIAVYDWKHDRCIDVLDYQASPLWHKYGKDYR